MVCDRESYYVRCDERTPGRLPHRQCFAAMGENYDRDAMPEHMYSTAEDAAFAWNQRASSKELTHKVCQWLRDEVGHVTACQKCEHTVATPYGPGVPMCAARAQELIALIRSGS